MTKDDIVSDAKLGLASRTEPLRTSRRAPRRPRVTPSTLLIGVVTSAFALACVLPLVLVVVNSFASEDSIATRGYSFLPHQFSLDAYKLIFYPGSPVIRSYGVSILVTTLGTAISVLITFTAAFALANKQVKYRNGFALFFFVTTIFSAGLVPWYLICRSLGLYDNIWALIIPKLLFSPFYLFIMRKFIQGVPDSLMESARMDGAGDLRIAFQIYFPLCAPVVAAVTLFTALGYWNDWFNAIMLVDDPALHPLQMLLFQLQSNINMVNSMAAQAGQMPPSNSFQMATVVVTMGPIVLLYPFLQRYLVKGLTVGGVKE